MRPSTAAPGLLLGLLGLGLGCSGETGPDTPQTPVGISDLSVRLDDDIGSIATVSWTQSGSATSWVEYTFEDAHDGGGWLQTPALEREAGGHEQVVLGVPYGTVFDLRVAVAGGETSEELRAQTAALPVELLQPELLASEAELWEPTGAWLLGSINTTQPDWRAGDYWMFVLDRRGRVVWAYPVPDQHFSIHAGLSLDGSQIFWDEITFWTDFDGGAGSQAHRMKIDGTIVESIDIPGANHAFTELPDGSVLWYAVDATDLTYSDGRLMKRWPDGTVEELWSCGDYHDSQLTLGNCLANTVYWHGQSDTVLLSFAMEDFVVEVDHLSGQTLRTFGQTPGAWDFHDEADWFWVQHGVSYTDAGTLLMSTHVGLDTEEACVREYELDEQGEQLLEVWSFGEGLGTTAKLGGDAQRLPSGNTLQSFGTTPVVKEITPEGTVAWEVQWRADRMIGRAVWVEDLYALAE